MRCSISAEFKSDAANLAISQGDPAGPNLDEGR
jgi:hypothetical protein